MSGKPTAARRRPVLLFGAAAVALGGAVYALLAPRQQAEVLQEVKAVQSVETAPLCPWREPEADLRRFFSGASGYEPEIRILSAQRAELARRLGRTPNAEENALYLYRVHGGSGPLGTVMVRRVKGEFGAIELALAVDNSGAVQGVRLQRIREPDAITAALTSPQWLGAFRGKSADADWRLGGAVPEVPPAAQTSARAVVDGVHSLLALYQVAQERGLRQPTTPNNHAAPGPP